MSITDSYVGDVIYVGAKSSSTVDSTASADVGDITLTLDGFNNATSKAVFAAGHATSATGSTATADADVINVTITGASTLASTLNVGGYATSSNTTAYYDEENYSSSSANVDSTTLIVNDGSKVSGATYLGGQAIGGAYGNASAIVEGDATLTVTGATVANVYGAGSASASTEASSTAGADNISITLKDSAVAGTIYSAGYASATGLDAQATVSVGGDVSVSLSDSQATTIIGGGYAASSYAGDAETYSTSTAEVSGIVDISISDSKLTNGTEVKTDTNTGALVAGGVAYSSATYAQSYASIKNEDEEDTAINISLTNTTVASTIVLAKAAATAKGAIAVADVYGDVKLSLQGEYSDDEGTYSTTITKTVYTGGYVYASGEGSSASVNTYGDISLDIDESKLTLALYGAGYATSAYNGSSTGEGTGSTASSNVSGTVTIDIDDSYTNAIQAGGYASASNYYASASADVENDTDEDGTADKTTAITLTIDDSYVSSTINAGGKASAGGAYSEATADVNGDISTSITSEVSGGSVTTAYGTTVTSSIFGAGYASAGGIASDASADAGNITLYVENAKTAAIYAAGSATVTSSTATSLAEGSNASADVSGIVDLDITDSYVATIYAGGVASAGNYYATASADVLNSLDSTSTTAISLNIENTYVAGSIRAGGSATVSGSNSTATADVEGSIDLDIEGDYTVVDGTYTYDTTITGQVYAAGYAVLATDNVTGATATADVDGSVDIDISGVKISGTSDNAISGGGFVSVTKGVATASADVAGVVDLSITDSYIIGTRSIVVAGTAIASYAGASASATIDNDLDGDEVADQDIAVNLVIGSTSADEYMLATKAIYVGGYATATAVNASAIADINGDIQLVVNGYVSDTLKAAYSNNKDDFTTQLGAIYVGGYASATSAGAYASIEYDEIETISITGAYVGGAIYGGAYLNVSLATDAQAYATLIGDIDIDLSYSYVTGTIYAAGYAGGTESSNADITGSVYVDIDTSYVGGVSTGVGIDISGDVEFTATDSYVGSIRGGATLSSSTVATSDRTAIIGGDVDITLTDSVISTLAGGNTAGTGATGTSTEASIKGDVTIYLENVSVTSTSGKGALIGGNAVSGTSSATDAEVTANIYGVVDIDIINSSQIKSLVGGSYSYGSSYGTAYSSIGYDLYEEGGENDYDAISVYIANDGTGDYATSGVTTEMFLAGAVELTATDATLYQNVYGDVSLTAVGVYNGGSITSADSYSVVLGSFNGTTPYSIYGGGYTYIQTSNSYVNTSIYGDVNIDITGAWVSRIYGGTYVMNTITDGTTTAVATSNNANISITDSYVYLIYSGGYSSNIYGVSTILGDVKVDIDNSYIAILYAGGYEFSDVMGNVDISINDSTVSSLRLATGSYDGNQNGTIYGTVTANITGESTITSTYAKYLSGTSILNIGTADDTATATISSSVEDIDTVNVNNGSTLTLNGTVTGVDVFNVNEGATLTWSTTADKSSTIGDFIVDGTVDFVVGGTSKATTNSVGSSSSKIDLSGSGDITVNNISNYASSVKIYAGDTSEFTGTISIESGYLYLYYSAFENATVDIDSGAYLYVANAEGSSDNFTDFTFAADITGEGYLYTTGNYNNFYFTGDLSDFSGILTGSTKTTMYGNYLDGELSNSINLASGIYYLGENSSFEDSTLYLTSYGSGSFVLGVDSDIDTVVGSVAEDVTSVSTLYVLNNSSATGDVTLNVSGEINLTGLYFGNLDGSLTLNVSDFEGTLYALYSYGPTYSYTEEDGWVSNKSSGVSGDLNLNISDSYIENDWLVYGQASYIDGDYKVYFNNVEFASEVRLLFSNSNWYSLADFYVGGDVNVEITGATEMSTLWIGLYQGTTDTAYLSETTIGGDIILNITGDDVVIDKIMVNGGRWGAVEGNIDIDISGGTYADYIVVGPNSTTLGTAVDSDTGNISMDITGGTFGTLYVGSHGYLSYNANYETFYTFNSETGYYEFVELEDSSQYYGGEVLGDVELNISAGTFNGDIYVGAYNAGFESQAEINAAWDKVSWYYEANGYEIGDVYGYYNVLRGDATATISGGTFNYTIYGGDADGTTSLIFDGYSLETGSVKVADFDYISAENASDLSIALTMTADLIVDVDSSSALAISAISVSSNLELTKTGEGDLVISDSLASLDGTLSIESGLVDYSNEDVLTLASLDIDSSATLAINASVLSSSTFTAFSNEGTINLTGGSLSDEADANISSTGALNITGSVSSEVTLSSELSVASTGALTINADNLANGIENAGTITLTDGTLASAITDAGDSTVVNIQTNSEEENAVTTISAALSADDINVDGTVIITDGAGSLSASTIDIAESASLEADADNLTALYISIAEDGELILTGGTLESIINDSESLTGTVTISGSVNVDEASGAIYADTLNITEDGTLTIVEGDLNVSYLVNDGSLYITEGVLDSSINIENNSDMLVDVDTLIGDNEIENNSDLTIQGDGELNASITKDEDSEDDSITIVKDNEGNSSSIMIGDNAKIITTSLVIEEGNYLSSDASLLIISDGIENEGSLTLTSGELSSAVSGEGTVDLYGMTVSASVAASDIDINHAVVLTDGSGSLISSGTIDIAQDASLTSNASSLEAQEGITNAGDLILRGGELSSTVSGTGDVSLSDTTISASVSATDIDLNGTVVVTDESGSLTALTIAIAQEANVTSNASSLSAANGITNAGDLTLTAGGLSSSLINTGYVSTDASTIASAEISNTGTIAITGGTYTIDTSIGGSLILSGDAALEVILNSNNATLSESYDAENPSYILGDVSAVDAEGESTETTIALIIDDIFSVLGTTTTLYDMENDLVSFDYGTYVDTYEGISIDEATSTIIIDSAISYKPSEDDDSDTSVDFNVDEDGNTSLEVSSGDYTLAEGTQNVDTVTTDENASLEVSTDTTLNAGTLTEGSTLVVTDGGEANVETVETEASATVSGEDSLLNVGTAESGSSITVNEGSTATVDTVETDTTLSATGSGSIASVGTLESGATVEVTDGATVEVADAQESSYLEISGTDSTLLIGDDTVEEDIQLTTTVALLNDEGDTEAEGAVVLSATSGSVTILTSTEDCNFVLTGGDYDLDEDSTLVLRTTGDDNTVSVSGESTISGENATLSIDSNLVLEDDSTFTVEANLEMSKGATLSEDATLSIIGDISGDDTTIVGDTNSTLIISADEDSYIAINNELSVEDVDNVSLSGSISSSQDTILTISNSEDKATVLSTDVDLTIEGDGDKVAVSLKSESVTVSGTLSVASDTATSITAIEVDNSTGTVTLADNTSINSSLGYEDGIAITNVHTEDEDGNDIGLNIVLEGSSTIAGKIVANSPLSISTVEGGAAEFTVVGSEITTSGTGFSDTITIGTGATLYLTTNTDGTMASIVNSGAIIADSFGLSILGSASMLVDESYLIADSDTVLAQSEDFFSTEVGEKYVGFSIDTQTGEAILTVDSLTYFQEAVATTDNERYLGAALDAIKAGSEDDSMLRDFKLAAEANGLSSYLMNNYSYIAEVDTMLLGNMNMANVNRARALLDKANFELALTEVEIVEEATGVEIAESEELSQIKYSNVAQLQAISFLGSKDATNGVAGYDYWSVGSTANFDKIFSENAIAGVSIGGVYNKVEGDAGDSANSTAFLLNAYAVAKSGIYPFEIFANLGYAHFWNEGGKGGASAEWDSDAFNALGGIAFDIETGLKGLSIKPLAMLNFVALNSDAATYSNGVDVDAQNYISAKIMAGVEIEYAMTAQFNAIVRAMYAYELGDESYDYTYGVSNIISDIDYIGGQAGKHSAVVGLGLSYDFSETCSAYFDYTAYIYESLITHSLNLSLGIKF